MLVVLKIILSCHDVVLVFDTCDQFDSARMISSCTVWLEKRCAIMLPAAKKKPAGKPHLLG